MGFLGNIAGGIAGAITGRGGGAGARQQFGVTQGAENNLGSVFNYAMPTAQAGYTAGQGVTNSGLGTTNAGVNTLTSPANYWQRIMSGNRPAAMQALAPQSNAAMQQGDAARRQAVASGTARGGGLAAPMQQQHSDMMSQIDNMLFGARGQAGQQLTNIGSTQAQAGLGEAQVGQDMVSKALQMLGLGANSASAQGGLAEKGMTDQAQFTNNTINRIGNAFGAAGQTDWTQPFKPTPA